MDSWYSGHHIVRDQRHADMTICNTKEPQSKYRLGTVSNRLHVL